MTRRLCAAVAGGAGVQEHLWTRAVPARQVPQLPHCLSVLDLQRLPFPIPKCAGHRVRMVFSCSDLTIREGNLGQPLQGLLDCGVDRSASYGVASATSVRAAHGSRRKQSGGAAVMCY